MAIRTLSKKRPEVNPLVKEWDAKSSRAKMRELLASRKKPLPKKG